MADSLMARAKKPPPPPPVGNRVKMCLARTSHPYLYLRLMCLMCTAHLHLYHTPLRVLGGGGGVTAPTYPSWLPVTDTLCTFNIKLLYGVSTFIINHLHWAHTFSLPLYLGHGLLCQFSNCTAQYNPINFAQPLKGRCSHVSFES